MRLTKTKLKGAAQGKDAKEEAEKEENTFFSESEFKELKF